MSVTNALPFQQATPIEAASGEPAGWQGRALALAVSAFAMVLGGLGLWLVAASHSDPAGLLGDYLTFNAEIALTFASVAGLVVLRRGPRLIGWILALIGFSHGLVAVADGLAVHLLHSGGSLVSAAWLAWIAPLSWIAGFALLTVFLPLLFPDGRLLSARWRIIGGLAVLWVALDAVGVGVAPRTFGLQALPGMANPMGIVGTEPLIEGLRIWEPIFLITMIAAVASLVIRFRRAEGRQRQQLKWLALGSSLFAFVTLLGRMFEAIAAGSLSELTTGMWLVAIPIIPATIGIAIARHRLFDIDMVISRGAAYVVLTFGVATTYVAIVGGLGVVLSSSGNLLIAVVATGVVAVLFEPARARVQSWVNRLLFGDRDDPYAALSRLGRRLEDTIAPAEILPSVVSVVAEALRLPYAAIALGTGDVAIVARSGLPVSDPFEVPLVHNGQRIGSLLLGRRAGDENFSQADRRLLEDFARQVALAAYAVRTTAELQAARERLVATREEERRKLRRDLHDVLGARLAGLNVQLGVLRALIKTDAVAADRLVVDLRAEIQAAIGGVRRILQDLRPTGPETPGLPTGTLEIDRASSGRSSSGRQDDPAASKGATRRAVMRVQVDRLTGWPATIVWLVAVVDIAAVASTGPILALPPDVPYIAALLYLAIAAPMATMGAMLATRRRHNTLGWVMWVAASAMAVMWFGWVYAAFSIRAYDGTLPATVLLAWISSLFFVPFVVLIVVVIPLLFPDGRLPSPRWRPIAIVAALSITLSVVVGAFAAGPMGNLAIDNPIGIEAVATLQPVLISIATLAFFVVLPIAAFGAPVARFRRGGPVERAQLKWFAYTAGVTAIAGGLTVVQYAQDQTSGTLIGIVFFLGMAALPVSIGIAVLRYRLFDIDALIGRSAVYGLLSLAVVGAYIAIVGGLGSVFGSTGNLLLAVIATGVVAVLFEPARARVQRAVSRLLFGERDDPYIALTHLGKRLEDTLTPIDVLPTVVSSVAEVLRLPYVAVALDQSGGMPIVAASGDPIADPLSVPLIHNGDRIGELLLGRRTGNDDFGQIDRRLLDDFASQVALAAYGVRATAELEATRERLVTARGEERRRLRRELHDELGTQLAALNLQMGSLRGVIETDPVAADRLALDLRREIRIAIGDVRRILHDLRPTALDQLGLPAALRAIAGQAERQGMSVTVELPDDLGTLPAAVDVAAYRIVQEAFANIARHARASRCWLRVWIEDGLQLVIRDDGVGISDRPGLGSGVGMSSMRERAAELGGSCLFSSAIEGGTIVSVRLPVSVR